MPLAYLLTYLTISSLLFLAHFVEKFSVLLLLLKFFFDSLWFTEEFLLSSHHYECFGALNNFLSETFRLQCWCLLYYRASWLAVVARDLSWRFSFFNWNHLKKKSFFIGSSWFTPNAHCFGRLTYQPTLKNLPNTSKLNSYAELLQPEALWLVGLPI